jgi:hypothetical protein
VVEEHAEVFTNRGAASRAGSANQTNRQYLSPGAGQRPAQSVDQAQIIYTSNKLLHNRNILPKLLNEPPSIESFNDYKTQVSMH